MAHYESSDDGSAASYIESEAASSFFTNSRAGSGVFSTASTNKFDNTGSIKMLPTSPISSSGGVSRNSLAAARLLRIRKDADSISQSSSQFSDSNQPSRLAEQALLRNDFASLDDDTSSRKMADDAQARFQARMRKKGATHRARVERVPGGAAAKIIGRPMQELDSEKQKRQLDFALSDDLKEEQIQEAKAEREEAGKVKELDSLRQKARHEFTLGSTENSRYRPQPVDETKEEKLSEASMPSILSRSEVFHENATAAVLALLTPGKKGKEFGDGGSVLSGVSNFESQTTEVSNLVVSPTKNGGLVVKSSKPTLPSAFQPPRNQNDNGSVVSNLTSTQMTTLDEQDSTYRGSRSPTKAPVLSPAAQKSLERMKETMKDPSKTLADLLTAIATPAEGTEMDRGFMVRRKNACGAIKVLTAKPGNRRTLCWTVGVLTSLTSVLADTGDNGMTAAFPGIHTQKEYAEARKRAVASLLNLSIPRENRIAIFHSAGLVQAVVSVINDDKGESRQGCCAILAYLAKTQENRLLLVQIPGLLDALTGVIRPQMPASSASPAKPKSKIKWDDETSDFRSDSPYRSQTDRFNADNDIDQLERNDDDSQATPRQISSPTKALSRMAEGYDADANKFLHGARRNVFALFFHAVKEKDNTYGIARHRDLMITLVDIAQLHSSISHVHAVKILAHLTRHKGNNKHIVFRIRLVVPALVVATESKELDTRKYACFAIQNLSQDKACRQEVASTKGLLRALCQRARQGADSQERLAGMSALKNLTDEPANLIPMTNTPECFASLMQIATASDVSEMMRYLACDALATLSHWLRKIASSGNNDVGDSSVDHTVPPGRELFVPSLKVITYSQWE